MKTKTWFFVTFLFIIINTTVGQINISPNKTIDTPQQYYLQVKQFGEFVDRFNYISDWKGNLIDSSFKSKMPRAQYIQYLIDNQDIRFKTPGDSAYFILCRQFINFITNNKNEQSIELYSKQVVANANVSINYKGKTNIVKIEFTPQVLNNKSAKWVISNVEANCFKNTPDSLLKYFISPNSHETGFINLKQIEKLSNPVYFFGPGYNTDQTILFLTHIAAGNITINNIEKVSYTVSFDGWEITVNEFIRNTDNSGWLISNIKNQSSF